MPGDYSRKSDNSHQRFSALFMQQGRVQLDADWNESVEILRRRIREEANDVFGPVAVPRETTPNGFQIGLTGSGAKADLTIAPGRIYVDGVLAEYFSDESYTYSTQPFLPNPPALSSFSGNVLVYLDVWEREITAVEDQTIVDPALNGVDTGTRLKTIWQVKLLPITASGATGCVSDFSTLFPPSGGRLSVTTLPPTQAPDPCSLPGSGGYQGVDNRFYRLQVHNASGPNPLVKWSRDNGSVATGVTNIVNGASSSTITVISIGNDDDLGFHNNDWVEIIDDAHELNGQSGIMANVTGINAALRTLTLDRPLTSGNFNPASGNVRVRRWDQSQGLYVPSGGPSSGLIQVAPGTPIVLENGIQITLTVASGGLHINDAWVFAARVATGSVDPLNAAPPIAIRHYYASLATITGLGGSSTPTPSDCRTLWPPLGQDGGCGCTVCVDAKDHNSGSATIQHAITQVIQGGGGVVCLGPGTFNLTAPATIAGAYGVTLRGVGPATILVTTATIGVLVFDSIAVRISDLAVSCALSQTSSVVVAVGVSNCMLATVERTVLAAAAPSGGKGVGVGVGLSGYLWDVDIRLNAIDADTGVWLFETLDGTGATLAPSTGDYRGNLVVSNLEFEENLILAKLWGIAIGGQVAADNMLVSWNAIAGGVGGIGFMGNAVTPLRVVGNFVSGATAVELACDNFVLEENVIQGVGNAATGVSVLSAPSGNSARGLIEGNRIGELPGGVAVSVAGDLSRLTLRDNTIDDADGGIILASGATVDDLVIEGNEITNIGGNSGTATLTNGFAGVAVVGATRAIIRGNTLMNVGTAYASGNGIVGIAVSQPTVVSVVDNELRGIGALSGVAASTYGVRIVGPYDDARITGNRVQATVPSSSTPTTALYSGISVSNPWAYYVSGVFNPAALSQDIAAVDVTTPPAASAAPVASAMPAASTTGTTGATTTTGATAGTGASNATTPIFTLTQPAVRPVLFQLNSYTSASAVTATATARKALGAFVGDTALTVNPDPLFFSTPNQQSLEVSGNAVDVLPSYWPLINAYGVGFCALRGNRVALATASSSSASTPPPANTSPTTAVNGSGSPLIASDNYVNAYTEVIGLSLLGGAKSTVLGNVSTSGIRFNGAALAAPWNALNGD